jgi:CheY-like chemotaxis protein
MLGVNMYNERRITPRWLEPFPIDRARKTSSILLADPDPDTRCMYATLMRHVGWRVYQTGDPDTAYLIARRLRPDVVVCELRMFLSSGVDLSVALERDPEMSSVFTVVVTGRLLFLEDASRTQLRSTQVITKPCTPSELLGVIERQRTLTTRIL